MVNESGRSTPPTRWHTATTWLARGVGLIFVAASLVAANRSNPSASDHLETLLASKRAKDPSVFTTDAVRYYSVAGLLSALKTEDGRVATVGAFGKVYVFMERPAAAPST